MTGSQDAMGATLRRLRLRRGINQTDFAEQIGVARPTVWSWEIGRTHPRESRIPALARALNVSENDPILSPQAVAERGERLTLEESQDATGAALRRLRLRLGINQTDFAEQIGVSRLTVWSWEKGKTHPRKSRIPALARALKVSENDLTLSPRAVAERDERPTLEEELALSKERLAAAAGTTPDMIEIIIKL